LKLVHYFYFALSLLIAGCSSTPSSTNYYLLNNQPTMMVVNNESKVEKKQIIVVSVIDLPEYLEQSHLVMQMADHQLHYANFHMWAEPLKQGFTKALLADLTKHNSAVNFIVESRELNQDNLTTLSVNVDFFHSTAESKVVLSGLYWLESSVENRQYNNQSFHFELQLGKDGYPHSVEKMRALVSQLAKQIIDGI